VFYSDKDRDYYTKNKDEVRTVSYPKNTGGFFLGVKATGTQVTTELYLIQRLYISRA
jgi:hypothetical protein